MNDTTKQEIGTPEVRDALRLEALPIVLALELDHHQGYLQQEELISHDELEETVREKLGLELAESVAKLYEKINEQMCDWNWQWLTFDCGFQQYYAQPHHRQASLVNLLGRRFVLQSNQCFPNDMTEISECLAMTEHAVPLLTEEVGHCRHPSQPVADETLVNAFLEAHLIKPVSTSSVD